MWDKIGKIAFEVGKVYVEKRGVDGVMEDANKVFTLAKKGVSNVGNMFASDNTNYEYQEETDESTLNYEYLDEYTENIISEIQSGIKEAKRLNVLSKEFTNCTQRALCTGFAAMSDLFSLENEITTSDFDILVAEYITPIDTECDKLLMLIMQKCKGVEESPVSY